MHRDFFNSNSTITANFASTRTFLKVDWSAPDLYSVTLNVSLVGYKKFTLTGDNGGVESFEVKPGTYLLNCSAGGRNGKFGALQQLNCSYPTKITIPQGGQEVLNISLSPL